MKYKTISVFFDENGNPFKDVARGVSCSIINGAFIGASNTTKVYFYYDKLLNEDDDPVTWIAVSKLPNGKIGSKVIESYLDEEINEHYALLELDSFYTQYKGDVYLALQGYQGGVQVLEDSETGIYTIVGTPTIQTTGNVRLNILYAPQFIGSDETENVNFQQILADLSTKLGIRTQTILVNELPTIGEDNVFYVIKNDSENPNKANIYIWNGTTQSYVWVGDNSLFLGDYYTIEQATTFENGIKARVTAVENELSSVASGGPAGVYATLSDLTTADPDHSHIYVVSSNGYWYYWNETQWTSGGTFMQSSFDTTLRKTSTNAPQNAIVTTAIENLDKFKHGVSLWEILSKAHSENLIDPLTAVNNKFYAQPNNIQSNSGYWYIEAPVVAGTRYVHGSYNKNNGYANFARYVCYLDENGDMIGSAVQTSYYSTAPTGAVKAIITYYKGSDEDFLNGATFYASSDVITNVGGNLIKYIDALYKENYISKDVKDYNVDGLIGRNINLFNPNECLSNCFVNSNGSTTENNSYNTSSAIPVKAGHTYYINYYCRKFGLWKFDTQNAYVFLDNVSVNYIFTPDYDGYLVVSLYIEIDLEKVIVSEIDTPCDFVPHEKKTLGNNFVIDNQFLSKKGKTVFDLIDTSANLYDYTKNVVGYIYSNNTINTDQNYSTCSAIPVSAGTTYKLSQRVRKFGLWKSDGTNVVYTETQNAGYTFTPEYDGFVRFSLWVVDGINKVMLVKGTTLPDMFIPYGDMSLNNGIDLNFHQLEQAKEYLNLKASVLNGKKYVACGDSFTHGDFTGGTTDLITEDGPYKGQYKVYPYIIGNRTKANIVNMAANGMTLATKSGLTNCFTYNDFYKTIPEDVDYITMYFGINDGHQSIPIGTIDDNTTDTFYGAWNIVLSWLLTNRPNAHIGVIISNGCDNTNYPTATINSCKKWGIAYLDINGDETLPYVIRTNMRANLSQEARNILDPQLMVAYGQGNAHPNGLAHEKESYMIQQFLERL